MLQKAAKINDEYLGIQNAKFSLHEKWNNCPTAPNEMNKCDRQIIHPSVDTHVLWAGYKFHDFVSSTNNGAL